MVLDELSFSTLSLLALTSFIINLFAGFILLVYAIKHDRFAKKLLSFSFLSLAIMCFYFFAMDSGLVLKYPHLYRTSALFIYSYMPFSYLHMKYRINGKKELSSYDLLHFLPIFIYLVDYGAFFARSGAEKLRTVEAMSLDLNHLFVFGEGVLLPQYAHYVLIYILATVYGCAQIAMLWKMRQQVVQGLEKWLRWAEVFAVLQFLFFIPPLIAIVFAGDPSHYWFASVFFSAILGCFTSVYLFLNPSILYGELTVNVSGRQARPKKVKQYSTFKDKKMQELKDSLTSHMKNQPYLKPGYSIRDLAADLSVPVHYLSHLINHEIGLNYNEYLNQHRIKYCLEKIDEGKLEKITIEALAYECGFRNRNTFISCFKKFTKKTPSRYLKNLQ